MERWNVSKSAAVNLKTEPIVSMIGERISSARPFLKWVGGKTQLLPEIDRHLPIELTSGNIQRYIEPFLGGGAVFFHAAQRYKIDKFVLSDANPDLVLAYRTVQQHVDQLIDLLSGLEEKYLRLDECARSRFFYEVRDSFNLNRNKIDPEAYSRAWLQRAAHLIFLNKTCFNGLYRVNSAGAFNASFGKYESPTICDEQNLRNVSALLSKAEILLGDFENTRRYAGRNAFVYLDPPYRPLSETANFTSYSASTFTALDQQRLASYCARLNEKGAKILMSSADPHNTNQEDQFFETFYKDFRITRTSANRMVNCKADRRGKINELLIMNY